MARAEFVFRYRRPCRIPEGRLLPLSGGMVGQDRVASFPALELDTGAGRGYVVLLRKGGETVGEKEIRTAGEPAQIRLTPDRAQLDADGKDLSFVTVEIVDKDGTLCPNADNLVNFQVEGNAFIAGVDNGSPISMERFKDNKRKAFYGKCLVVLQNTGKPGEAKLTATSEGLSQAEISVVAE